MDARGYGRNLKNGLIALCIIVAVIAAGVGAIATWFLV